MWREIPGYEGFYEVSDQGFLRSVDRVVLMSNGVHRPTRGVALRTRVNPANGYEIVNLVRNAVRVTFPVHRLVMLAFVGPCPPGQEVLHGPGGKLDNRLVNLRYGTHIDNCAERLKPPETFSDWRLA